MRLVDDDVVEWRELVLGVRQQRDHRLGRVRDRVDVHLQRADARA